MGINDGGQIVGFGLLADGEQQGSLLIPSDDDHPNVEGCDYSMVDAGEIANSVAAAQAAQSIPQATNSLLRMMNASRNPFMRRWPTPGLRSLPQAK
jgi:hypothetical protein